MPVIAVFNQKGGVGKTTTTLNVGAAILARHPQTLLIDSDPQSSLTVALGIRNVPATDSLYAFYKDAKPLADLVQAPAAGLRVVPASLDLSKIETMHSADASISRRLKEGVNGSLAQQNTPILIDCCPMLGVLTLNALIAADHVLLPVAADFLSLEGANKLHAALAVLETRLQKRFVRRVVITRFDSRRKLSHDIRQQLHARFGKDLCETVIKETVGLAESPANGKHIFAYAPGSRGAADYQALTDELEAGHFFSQKAE